MMNLLAAFVFFTRLPFWRICPVPADSFKHVVPRWPVVGWLTGGVMAATLWLGSHFLPLNLAWLVAILSRILITGALHEDGLADFSDGFGGGTSRRRTLEIMKDSHIGTYGVLGLVFYLLFLWQVPFSLPLPLLCTVAFCGDVWSKGCAAQLINVLPYARTEADSKAKVVYGRMSGWEFTLCLLAAALPLVLLLPLKLWWAAVVPLLVFVLLWRMMRRRLQGYTGDCCGATFLLCELSFYFAVVLLWKLF